MKLLDIIKQKTNYCDANNRLWQLCKRIVSDSIEHSKQISSQLSEYDIHDERHSEKVIEIIENSSYIDIFNAWRNAKKVKVSKEEPKDVYFVHHGAKIRYIDPLWNGERISKQCKIAEKMIINNLAYKMDNYIYLDFTF